MLLWLKLNFLKWKLGLTWIPSLRTHTYTEVLRFHLHGGLAYSHLHGGIASSLTQRIYETAALL